MIECFVNSSCWRNVSAERYNYATFCMRFLLYLQTITAFPVNLKAVLLSPLQTVGIKE